MLITTTPDPEGRWRNARVLLRLAGLGAVWLGLVKFPPGVAPSGQGLAVALCAGVSSLCCLAMLTRPRAADLVTVAVLATQVLSGSVLVGLAPGGPAVALPAIGIFDAVVQLAPRLALAITVAGVTALAVTAVEAGHGVPAVAAYSYALAAALLLGLNRRQYITRAEQADLLLAQSQLAQREQTRAAALDERARIAREIHDVLAHSLGALAVQLDVAEALLDSDAERGSVRDHIGRARTLAVDGLAEARRAVGALRGDALPVAGLLDGVAAQYRTDQGAPARLQVSGAERQLSPDAALAILRTAQEAISNARKHAVRAAITLRLAYQADATVLTVTDEPCHADTGASSTTTALAATGAGYGLTGLRERAELLGGTLSAGPDGAGWTVELRLPVHP